MKKLIRDILISTVIGASISYLIYIIKGGMLHGDLYNQGIDFLQYYRDNISFLGLGYNYNWSIALGDNMYALSIYYLTSPFNLLLALFKGIQMEKTIIIFITIKIIFLIYFSSLYFKEVTSYRFRWCGALIYSASYYILNYSSLQIMWLDTFILLPLVLLGIENIINNKESRTYIISLFFFIISDYYLAVLLIPHIAIYGLLRYVIINKKDKKVIKFIINMIQKSLISVSLSAFVLLPAIVIMKSSAKETGVVNNFTSSILSLFSIFKDNYIGAADSISNTYLTLIGVLILISYTIFSKNKDNKLYLIHILILILGVYSEKINYFLNLTYMPVGGNYRYNLLFNIYVAIFMYNFIIEAKNNIKMKYSLIPLSILSMINIMFNKNITIKLIMINLLFIIVYISLIYILISKNRRKFLVHILTIILLLEVSSNYYLTYNKRSIIENKTRISYSEVIDYVKDKYGEDSRIEIRSNNISKNIYIANDAMGTSSYHSLINGQYKNISKVFGNTIKDSVRVDFKGRNIIASYIGTKYYVTSYNYCPYYNAELIDKLDNFYIFEVNNKEFKYFEKDSVIKGKLPYSILEKDIILYNNLLIENNKENINTEALIEEKYKIYDLYTKDTIIEESGEYYAITSKESDITYIPFMVNGDMIGEDSHFSNIYDKDLDYNELYIGKLEKGDILTIEDKFLEKVKLIAIDNNYINTSIEKMNSIDISSIEKDKKGLIATLIMPKEGYVVLPIVYDKYWNIKVDGNKVEPLIVNEGFMALELGSGSHILDMKFNFYIKDIGIFISMITLILIFMKSKKIKSYKERLKR